MTIDEQIARIGHGAVQVTPLEVLRAKLTKKKKLLIKLGMDPTAPDLHLGHAVVLQKLRTFQELGHTIIFIIGDFTARIGDPSGRSKVRPPLSAEEIATNAATYFEQVGRILDRAKMTVHYNSDWLGELSLQDFIKLAAQATLARIIERDDFAKRLSEQEPISLHELFYPILQGYDSVELRSDVELGGTDQTFNLLMGRHMQEQLGQEGQVILTMPILEGLDGVQKMSKSLGNYIGLSESSEDAYGKLMSISDDLMWRYYALLLEKTLQEISVLQEAISRNEKHPMALKKEMAHGIVSRFWTPPQADAAQKRFEGLFEQRDYSNAQEVSLPQGGELWIVDLLKSIGAIKTSSEAKRLIEDGAVTIDEQPVTDFRAKISPTSGMILRVGKHRFYKLV